MQGGKVKYSPWLYIYNVFAFRVYSSLMDRKSNCIKITGTEKHDTVTI